MQKQGFQTAKRRYHRSFWPLMGLYVIAILGGSFWFVQAVVQYETAPLWLSVGVALAATLPLIGVLLVILRYFDETDEYTRLKQLKAFAQGAVFTMSAIFLTGFLQLFDVIGSVDVFWFGPVFLASWGFAYCLAHCFRGEAC